MDRVGGHPPDRQRDAVELGFGLGDVFEGRPQAVVAGAHRDVSLNAEEVEDGEAELGHRRRGWGVRL